MATRRAGRTAEQRLQRLLDLQALLSAVSREIGPALEVEPVLKTVLLAMRSLVEFRGGTIQLVDERGCYIAAADPAVSPELAATRVPVGTGLSGSAVATGRTVYSPDLDDDPRVDPVQRRTGSNAPTHSYLVVPLIVLSECIGVMQIDSNDIDAFDTEDRAVLEGLATQVAGSIESARRYEHVLELERLKDDFIARISHELRTPLTIMSGFTETLLIHAETLDPAERRDALRRVKSSADRLGSLLEEILYISRLDAGITELHPEKTSLFDLARQVRERSVDPESVQVVVATETHVLVDAALLKHVLALIVDNALKYAGDATIASQVDPRNGEVVLSVRDHGPGIPVGSRQLIFERFWRGQHPGSGMGLGLPTARQLAAAIGARIEIGDVEGAGAQVDVRLSQPPR